MALQLERAIGRRVMIHGLPITMILCYCIKPATLPFSTLLKPAPCIPFPHWLTGLLSILKVAPRFSSVSNFAAFSPLGFLLCRAKKERVERVQCPLENVLLETLIKTLELSLGWGKGAKDNRHRFGILSCLD